jgi:hypothetical protein
MREYSITDAGLMLSMTYGRVRDLAMRGVLKGRRTEQGRLMVTAESVDQYRRERGAVGTAA